MNYLRLNNVQALTNNTFRDFGVCFRKTLLEWFSLCAPTPFEATQPQSNPWMLFGTRQAGASPVQPRREADCKPGYEGFTKPTSKCVHPLKGTVFEGLPNKTLLALPAGLSCQSAEHHGHHHAAMDQIHFDITAFHFSFVLHARSKKQLRVKSSPPSSAHTQANPNKRTQGTERKGEAKQKHSKS